ncbi:hypothetical protein NUW58_g5851 [Xylaria curta]|uniref:Uncharacterized protein n=1 Tax=Xylaria curta TaxID=42375 RepID=A0ACC1P0T3_9PEZI|nr:hypothetical protein NUW58_g5851 [Xylaria curta]
MKVSDDHSVFAWTWIAELTGRTSFKTVAARLGRLSLDFKPNFPSNRVKMLLHNRMRRDATRPTLLAPDPACFFDASAVPALKPPGSLGIFTMTNVGLSVSLPILGHLCGKLFFAVLHVNHNSGNDTMTVIMIPLARHYEHQDRWTRTPFPVAPVTAVLRNRGGLALKLETIQVCRDIQHVPFYFDAFGGTSHPFGFWLFFPRVRELSRAGLHLDDGCVLGNGAYNTHGVFFKPDKDRWRQLVGGLLIFHMQDAWSQWHDKIILLFLCLEVKKASDGILRKKSHHCKISIQLRAPIDAPQLLSTFVAHVQKHIDDGGQSTYMCDGSFKQRFRGFGEHSPLGYQNFTLHASAGFLNDEPLSYSHRSEITLTELNLWSSGKRAKTFDQFGENPLREDTRMTS